MNRLRKKRPQRRQSTEWVDDGGVKARAGVRTEAFCRATAMIKES
jgi:hypothetical protein